MKLRSLPMFAAVMLLVPACFGDDTQQLLTEGQRAYLRGDIEDRQLLAYAGRPISASPAVGYMSKHIAQQQQLVRDAFAAELGSGEMVTAH